MRIIILDTKEEVAVTVANLIGEQISRNLNSVLGLATGKTMEAIYAEFQKVAQTKNLSLEKLHFFMLDEYLGLAPHHPSSFRSYIKQRVLEPLKISDSQISFPPVHLDAKEAGRHYEQEIEKYQGIDLQLLGVGRNGHVGFNEPGSERISLTRVVELTADTRDANKSDFNGEEVPKFALSMGIETIFRARELILVATGSSKADAIYQLMNGSENSECPVTFLKNHERFTVVLDREAASKLS